MTVEKRLFQSHSQQEIDEEITEVRKHLVYMQGLWAGHIKHDHGGVVIPTTCHQCMNLRMGIEGDEEMIRTLESEKSRR